MVTKKYLNAISKAVAGNTTVISGQRVVNHDKLVHELSGILSKSNPNFDPKRFIDACTPKETTDLLSV